jgi:hypothetical protein
MRAPTGNFGSETLRQAVPFQCKAIIWLLSVP